MAAPQLLPSNGNAISHNKSIQGVVIAIFIRSYRPYFNLFLILLEFMLFLPTFRYCDGAFPRVFILDVADQKHELVWIDSAKVLLWVLRLD